MRYSVFSESVVGYKNFMKNKSSQDYVLYRFINKGILCAVADGHSGSYYTFSDRGSKIACKSFIDVFNSYIDDGKKFNDLLCMINNKSLQKDLCERWRNMVSEDFRKIMPRVFKLDYFRYGTTLLGAYINEEYRFFLKIGDGEILERKYNNFIKIFDKKKGYYVDTLSEEKAFTKIQCKIEKVNKYNNNFPIVLYSDGLENSFKSYNLMTNYLKNIIDEYHNNIFSRNLLIENYRNKLVELSKTGSKDDITIAFINIT